MPPLLSDESAEKIADFLAKKMSKHDESNDEETTHINERTQIPLAWFVAAIVTLATATFTAANWWFDFNYRQQNAVTVKYISLYSKDLQEKNPSLNVPNAWEIMEQTQK